MDQFEIDEDIQRLKKLRDQTKKIALASDSESNGDSEPEAGSPRGIDYPITTEKPQEHQKNLFDGESIHPVSQSPLLTESNIVINKLSNENSINQKNSEDFSIEQKNIDQELPPINVISNIPVVRPQKELKASAPNLKKPPVRAPVISKPSFNAPVQNFGKTTEKEMDSLGDEKKNELNTSDIHHTEEKPKGQYTVDENEFSQKSNVDTQNNEEQSPEKYSPQNTSELGFSTQPKIIKTKVDTKKPSESSCIAKDIQKPVVNINHRAEESEDELEFLEKELKEILQIKVQLTASESEKLKLSHELSSFQEKIKLLDEENKVLKEKIESTIGNSNKEDYYHEQLKLLQEENDFLKEKLKIQEQEKNKLSLFSQEFVENIEKFKESVQLKICELEKEKIEIKNFYENAIHQIQAAHEANIKKYDENIRILKNENDELNLVISSKIKNSNESNSVDKFNEIVSQLKNITQEDSQNSNANANYFALTLETLQKLMGSIEKITTAQDNYKNSLEDQEVLINLPIQQTKTQANSILFQSNIVSNEKNNLDSQMLNDIANSSHTDNSKTQQIPIKKEQHQSFEENATTNQHHYVEADAFQKNEILLPSQQNKSFEKINSNFSQQNPEIKDVNAEVHQKNQSIYSNSASNKGIKFAKNTTQQTSTSPDHPKNRNESMQSHNENHLDNQHLIISKDSQVSIKNLGENIKKADSKNISKNENKTQQNLHGSESNEAGAKYSPFASNDHSLRENLNTWESERDVKTETHKTPVQPIEEPSTIEGNMKNMLSANQKTSLSRLKADGNTKPSTTVFKAKAAIQAPLFENNEQDDFMSMLNVEQQEKDALKGQAVAVVTQKTSLKIPVKVGNKPSGAARPPVKFDPHKNEKFANNLF